MWFMVKQRMICLSFFEWNEIGVQMEPSNPRNNLDPVESLFMQKLEKNEGVMKDVYLSEEGGRFYHEQNRNIIIGIDKDEIKELPNGYFWVRYSTLNNIVQFNNFLNIQLRNLTTLLDI